MSSAGGLLYDSAFLSRPKGCDKSGLAARFALFEGMGPCRFELFAVEGYRPDPDAGVRVEVRRHAGSATARARGRTQVVPHHIHAELTLGGSPAKQRVYAESVRAAVTDLVRCVASGEEPLSGAREGWAAVVVADAARRAAAEGRTVDLDPWPTTTDQLVRTS